MVNDLQNYVLSLTISHWANGTKTYLDENGLMYERVWFTGLASEEAGGGSSEGSSGGGGEGGVIQHASAGEWILYGLLSCFCVLFAGLTSGLNLSLLALNPLKLKFLEESEDEYNREVVRRIKPLLKNRHFMLVTLLICNAASLESLPIFLDKLVSSWLAILVSVIIVLFFGEIFPQAWLASDPLKAGYHFGWLVQLLEIITFPITYPLAWLLDKIVKHEHAAMFTHEEMATLFDVISGDKEYADTKKQFEGDELLLLEGALRLRKVTVEQEMVKWEDVKTFPYGLILDEDGIASIWECGFSRVPVYKEHEMDIVGICLVKDLLLEKGSQPILGDCVRRKPVIMAPDTTLIKAINIFQEKRTHFALITDDVDVVNECLDKGLTIPRSVRFLGAITFEDITEEIIQEEIEDEYSKERN